MAGFCEVMRQARRMCRTYKACVACPFEGVCEIGNFRTPERDIDLKVFEETVMKWAAEHPEPRYPTWYEWQESNFEGHTLWICPMAFSVPCPCARSVTSASKCAKCRNNQIPAHIAEKLGIKPIGGAQDG